MFRAVCAFVEDYGPDHTSFDLGEPGGITTSFLAKVPGPRMLLGQAKYTPGSYGPQKMQELIAPRRWWLPEP